MKKVILSIICIVAFTSFPTLATTDSFYLEDLTWPEVKARMDKGLDTIIIPTGGTEQNGPAIAIDKHNWIVRYTSGEIARQLGNALAAPVLAYVPEGRINPPEGHMNFPGTISLREEVFALVLEDAARSFKQEGFKRIYFIGDSGGNQEMQRQVADKLSKEWKSEGITIMHVSNYYTKNGETEWLKIQNPDIHNADAHAGFLDASEIMAAHGAESVRMSMIKHYTAKDYPINGSMGDPSGATVEYGKALLALKIRAAIDQINNRPSD